MQPDDEINVLVERLPVYFCCIVFFMADHYITYCQVVCALFPLAIYVLFVQIAVLVNL
jgi:hypothetical protein